MTKLVGGGQRHIRYSKSEGQRFNAETSLTTVVCSSCGVLYAIPTTFYNSLLKYRGDQPNGWKTVCPFGHEWWYVGETEEEKAERHRTYAENRANRLQHRLEQTEASRRGHKGAATKARKERDRIAHSIHNGVCPVKGCKRSFRNVRLHMTKMHPDYDVTQGDEHVPDP